jgi:hypothetical protein
LGPKGEGANQTIRKERRGHTRGNLVIATQLRGRSNGSESLALERWERKGATSETRLSSQIHQHVDVAPAAVEWAGTSSVEKSPPEGKIGFQRVRYSTPLLLY